MNTLEELAALRRRIGGVEHELEQLKLRVAVIERGVVVGQAGEQVVLKPEVPLAKVWVDAPPRVEPPPLPKGTEAAPVPVRHAAPIMPPLPVPPLVFARAPKPSFLEMIQPWLERAQLWPPQGEANREVQLGAWWATRLGILFAVIGAVFFGVYVSLDTQPWVKFIELLGASLGVVALGVWLERKTPRFGQVVFAGGLALVFFATMAAYTVPAVKVLENRFAAALCQLVVTAVIGGIASRKNSQPVATLAVVLGYVAAWFSFSGGFALFALVSALGFAGMAVVWRRRLDWEVPSVAALVGYWIVYGTLLVGLDPVERVVLPVWVWCFVVGGFAVFFWRDDRAGRTQADVDEREMWVQNASSTAALALGWLTAWLAFPERIGFFYAAAAGVLGLAAWRRAKTVSGDLVSAVLIAKALGALTLAVIKWTDPPDARAGAAGAGGRDARHQPAAAVAGDRGGLGGGGGGVTGVLVGRFVCRTGGDGAFDRGGELGGAGAAGLSGGICGVDDGAGAGLRAGDRRAFAGVDREIGSAVAAVLALVAGVHTSPVELQPTWLMVNAAVLGIAGAVWRQTAVWGVVGAARRGGSFAGGDLGERPRRARADSGGGVAIGTRKAGGRDQGATGVGRERAGGGDVWGVPECRIRGDGDVACRAGFGRGFRGRIAVATRAAVAVAFGVDTRRRGGGACDGDGRAARDGVGGRGALVRGAGRAGRRGGACGVEAGERAAGRGELTRGDTVGGGGVCGSVCDGGGDGDGVGGWKTAAPLGVGIRRVLAAGRGAVDVGVAGRAAGVCVVFRAAGGRGPNGPR